MATSTPNLVKIPQTAAELWKLSFFKMASDHHLGFCWILFSDHPRSLPDELKLSLKFYFYPIYTFEYIAIFRNLA